ncbi:MAG: hypothetical protein DSM107014_04315 [Gomphosphaeria aponina SAG 52.96 = DSM 107014]|uniref:Chromosome partitioning protein ParB n=1 Tax=Gomphosphaeria aponina SAG 52.96 = DSM 107014 TaxID=1521640 RepID=A0A941GVT1_9CHRO|nr:hypothetical protein [Gomphosphaeria aponina SAG 52.96 = DSM 107014]
MKKVGLGLITIGILLILSASSVNALMPDCRNTECQISIGDLHPTQAHVGMYQVNYTVAWLKLIEDGKSQKFASIEELLKQKVVPVVIGPEGKLYLVDHHHLLRAIWNYYQGNPNTKVYIKYLQNWEDKPDFWAAMQTNNYTYLETRGKEIQPSELPNSIGDLTDDPYRAAVGMAMQWGLFKQPEGEAKYFYELKWGDCLQKQGFDLGKELDRSEIFRTIAFLYQLGETNNINSACSVPVPQGKNLDEITEELD